MKYETYRELTSGGQEENLITSPGHYNISGLEVIYVITKYAKQYPSEVIYEIGNVFKYLCRAPYKGQQLEDLKKARQYLNRAINALEGIDSWEANPKS